MRLDALPDFQLPRPLAVVGAAAVAGPGLFRQRHPVCDLLGALSPSPASPAAPSVAVSAETLALAETGSRRPLASPKAHKQMSRAARLAAATIAQALEDAGWDDERTAIGAFLGVGSSGAALSELTALLAGSLVDGKFSLQAFGERGLGAANPLLAFQLMNNFTLCHGAIQSGLGGPSGAYFSRGSGTVSALRTAAWALLDPAEPGDGSVQRALVGGADSALHPVTLAELRRAGALSAGLLPGEGAAVLALSTSATADAAQAVELLACGVLPGLPAGPLAPPSLIWVENGAASAELIERALSLSLLSSVDGLVIGAALPTSRQLLRQGIERRFPQLAPSLIDISPLGETLAAGPALGFCVALAALRRGSARRIATLSLGLDGDCGLALFGRRP